MAPLTAAQKKAKAAAKAGGYVDKNMDGVRDPDRLSREEMAAQYQSAMGIIYSVPEVSRLFNKAVKQQWEPERFNAEVQNSDWYRNNNKYFRAAWAAENFGKVDGQTSADWQASLENARSAVQQSAVTVGADVDPAQLDALARRYIYEGWGEPGREPLMARALSEEIEYLPSPSGTGTSMRGASGNLADSLKKLAISNGISFNDGWYQSAVKSVVSGLSTAADKEREVREQAAGLWPVFADRIRSGETTAMELASPYMNVMAQEFEMSPQEFTLNDPYIRSALTGMDDKGYPTATNLYDFQKKLRQDPRWMKTSKAQNDITGSVGKVMQMFGLMGDSD